MPHYDSLTREQRRIVDAAMTQTHHREVELVVIRRSDGQRLQSLTNRFLGGSIQGDDERTPATVMECDVLDDEFALDWSHGKHRRFAVQVVDHRFIPELDDWVEKEVHTGRIRSFRRKGVEVHLVVEGPEWDAMGSVRRAASWPARTRASKVIRELLEAAGALSRDLLVPKLRATLPRDVTVGVRRGKDQNRDRPGFQGRRRQVLRVSREDTYWGAAEPIAEAIDRDLFGDGAGRFVLRRPVSRATFTVNDRMLLSPVTEQPAEDEEGPNTWVVLGADPQGPRKRVQAEVALPRRHPSSAWSQRWNGTPRRVIETIENPQLRTHSAARRVGERRRDRAQRETVTYEAELLPCVFWIRPRTMWSLPVRQSGRATSLVRRWSLPLGPGADPVTIGTTRRRGWRG